MIGLVRLILKERCISPHRLTDERPAKRRRSRAQQSKNNSKVTKEIVSIAIEGLSVSLDQGLESHQTRTIGVVLRNLTPRVSDIAFQYPGIVIESSLIQNNPCSLRFNCKSVLCVLECVLWAFTGFSVSLFTSYLLISTCDFLDSNRVGGDSVQIGW